MKMRMIRNKIGTHLRENYSGIYQFYLKIIETSPSFYVLDYLGGSFKEYFLKQNMLERIIALKKNLDEYSLHTVDVLILRFLNYPESHYKFRMKVKAEDVIGGLLEEETKENRLKVNKSLNKIHRKYNISRALMEPSVFYYHHGLFDLPEQVKNYIKEQDFLDLGAYIGDSALALYQYGYKKIYSIEMSRKSIERYEKLMSQNHINASKYELINAAISAKDNLPPISFSDTGDSNIFAGNEYIYIYGGEGGGGGGNLFNVEQISLDTLVKKYDIIPKFIKADIEGFSLELVKGAVNTLKRYRPVLSLCIYHNPYEFFEVKPFLENIIDNYTYHIRKFTVSPFTGGCHGETTLIAYPNEILKP